jgi:Fe2+ transport system protein B
LRWLSQGEERGRNYVRLRVRLDEVELDFVILNRSFCIEALFEGVEMDSTELESDLRLEVLETSAKKCQI